MEEIKACSKCKDNNKNEICHNCQDGEKQISNQSCCQCGNHASNKSQIKRNLILLGFSFMFLILGLIDLGKYNAFFEYFNFAWLTVIISGVPILISAFNRLAKKKITSNFLISVAIIASIVLEILRIFKFDTGGGHSSYIVAAGEIAILMAIGGLLEDFIVSKSKSGLERLVKLSPNNVNLKIKDGYKAIKLADVKIGDIILVKPDEIIPVDGIIVSGQSSVDTSNITGEHIPIDVKKDSLVYSGTTNKYGAIEIKVNKEAKDMTMQKLIELTKEAEGRKAPISRIADKWASFIVPIAIITAILVFVTCKFAFNISYLNSFIRATTVLVVFCPCALALATPTAIAAGIGNASKKGVVIKSGEALENLSKIKTFCFDKTGTLTTGQIKVDKIKLFNISEKEFLKIVGSVESLSVHPIAEAITNFAKEKVKLVKVKDVKSSVGKGIEATVNKKHVLIETAYLLKLDEETRKQVEELENRGYTVVGVEIDKILAGLIILNDEIRPTSKKCISLLKKANVKTIMLTGDNSSSARLVREELMLDDCYSSMLPEDKLLKIKEIQNNNRVCMIGDGVNDAPSLAQADCSIAIGTFGNSTAVETADIAIMNNDLNNVYKVKKLSNVVVNTIIRNIIISMSINVISVILSLFGLLNPVGGAIVHNISSLFVVISSACLLIYDRDKKSKAKEEKSNV